MDCVSIILYIIVVLVIIFLFLYICGIWKEKKKISHKECMTGAEHIFHEELKEKEEEKERAWVIAAAQSNK